MKKGVWRSQISWLFLNHFELSENQKKWFLVQADSAPLHSSNIQKLHPIRVKKSTIKVYKGKEIL